MKSPADYSVYSAAVAPSFARWATATLLTTAVLLTANTPTVRALTSVQRTYWDPGPVQTGTSPGSGGNGVWDTSTANWVSTSGSGDVPFPNASSVTAYFAGAVGTVSLNASGLSAGTVEFDTAGYVLQDMPGTGYALTLTSGTTDLSAQISSGTVTVSAPLNLTSSYGGTLNARTGGTLAIPGILTVTNGLYIGNNPNAGMVILSGNNAITGLTRVDEGTLQLASTGTNQPLGGTSSLSVTNQGTLLYGASNQVPAGVPVTMFANGTINVNGQSQDRAHVLGALTLSSSYAGDISALDFGAGASTSSVLAFGNSSGVAWSGTLSVYDYRGTATTGGGTDRLFFGTDATGLTPTQLGEISFYRGGAGSTLLGTGLILSNGEVTYSPVPVPEPATWLGGLLLGLVGARVGWRRSQRPSA